MLNKLAIKAERHNKGFKADLTGCSSFSLENQGNTTAYFGDPNEGLMIDLPPGSQRIFGGAAGAAYNHIIEVEFDEKTAPGGVPSKNIVLLVKETLTLNC